MKKYTVLFIAFLLILSLLTACGKGIPSSSNQIENDTKETSQKNSPSYFKEPTVGKN